MILYRTTEVSHGKFEVDDKRVDSPGRSMLIRFARFIINMNKTNGSRDLSPVLRKLSAGSGSGEFW